MSNVIDLRGQIFKNFQQKARPVMMKEVSSNIIHIDFEKRSHVKTEVVQALVLDIPVDASRDRSFDEEEELFDMTHFEVPPRGSPSSQMTNKQRTESSNHALKHVSDLSAQDILDMIKAGLLDKEKLAKALGVEYQAKMIIRR